MPATSTILLTVISLSAAMRSLELIAYREPGCSGGEGGEGGEMLSAITPRSHCGGQAPPLTEGRNFELLPFAKPTGQFVSKASGMTVKLCIPHCWPSAQP